MANVQHIYVGEGSPIDLGQVAPVGSHFIDQDSGDVWFCNWSDGESSDWRCMAVSEPVGVVAGSFGLDAAVNYQTILSPGALVSLGIEGAIYSNVELTGEPRSFTAASACLMRLQPLFDGGAVLVVTPLDAY